MKAQNEITPVKLSKRITGWFLICLTLFNTLFTAYAQAANLLATSSITTDLANNYEFETAPAEKPYLYQKANYINAQGTVNNQTLETFHAKIVQNKVALPAKQWLPIAGDITLFIPHYPIGKIMGDGFVQNRYVRAQIYNQLGRHLIDPALYTDESAQANTLYNNAYSFAQTQGNRVPFGTPLSASENITADMIWPEYRDINGQKVLVPIVYLTQATIDARRVKGHVINLGTSTSLKSLDAAGVDLTTRRNAMITTMGDLSLNRATLSTLGNLALIVRGTLNNINASISATDLLNINALQLVNNGGTLSAGSINIDKTGIVQNVSGTIQANGNIRIVAGEIISKPVVYQFKDKNGSGTRLGTVASINSQNGNIELETLKNGYANGDITIQGATVSATNGAITFNAANNINISAISTQYQTTYRDGDWEVNQSNINLLQSRLNAKETIKLIAGGAINITASELISTAGGIELLAEQGIYILDELNQEQIQRVDRKGKTTGQSSEFRTEAVRAVLRAGKGILLDSAHGDVVLKASKLSSTNGAQVYARDGKVRMLMTKELEEFHLNTVKKGTWTIKTRTEDVINETNIQNAIVGGFQVQAMYGVDVEYTGKDGATLQEQINEFRQIPEMKWMADLYDQALAQAGPNLNWSELEEIHKELKKTKKNLSPAAMAIIAIAVAVVTAGAGAALVGAVQGTTYAAVANAAVTTLATQAAQSLAAGNSPSATLKSMGSSDSLKSLAVSMVTAGVMQHTDLEMFKSIESDSMGLSIAKQAGQATYNATVSAGISVAINGGNFADFKQQFVRALASDAINELGKNLSSKIGAAARSNDITTATQYILHAGLGCLSGSLTSAIDKTSLEKSCYSGAAGGLIGEFVTQQELQGLEADTQAWVDKQLRGNGSYTGDQLERQINRLVARGVDMGRLAAGLAAFATKGDVNIAASSAYISGQFNAASSVDVKRIAQKIKNGVWTWTDEKGVVHFGNAPPPSVGIGIVGDDIKPRDPARIAYDKRKLQAEIDCFLYDNRNGACSTLNHVWTTAEEKTIDDEDYAEGSPAQRQLREQLKKYKEIGAAAGEVVCSLNEGCLISITYENWDTMSSFEKAITLIPGAGLALREARVINRHSHEQFEIAEDKFEYIYGRVTSNPHNAARSKQMKATMDRLGIPDTDKGRDVISEHFAKTATTDGNVINRWSDEFGSFEERESFFMGPNGESAVFHTTFKVLDDGTRKFSTAIPKEQKR